MGTLMLAVDAGTYGNSIGSCCSSAICSEML